MKIEEDNKVLKENWKDWGGAVSQKWLATPPYKQNQ